VGVAYAPSPTPIFVSKDSAGNVRGVPRDLGTALAKSLGVPVEIVVMATTGELTDACSAGAIDIGFMPADDERRKRLDFSPPYFVIESTYLAAGASDIKGDRGRRSARNHGRRHCRLDHHAGRGSQSEGRDDRPGEVRR
jgi:polar amino acid transport system substrate-binding protein